MEQSVLSKGGVVIRLTDERWTHVTEEHSELAGLRLDVLETISEPDHIVAGAAGELLGIREIEPTKWLVVVYRELDADGFVMTAFATRRGRWFSRRRQLWP